VRKQEGRELKGKNKDNLRGKGAVVSSRNVIKITGSGSIAEVGTRYFFRSPLPLVRYLKIVLPLQAGLQLKQIW
jgi:hypothetical protein